MINEPYGAVEGKFKSNFAPEPALCREVHSVLADSSTLGANRNKQIFQIPTFNQSEFGSREDKFPESENLNGHMKGLFRYPDGFPDFGRR